MAKEWTTGRTLLSEFTGEEIAAEHRRRMSIRYEPSEIQQFVDKVRELDKRDAIRDYIRTGVFTSDYIVAGVLKWLEGGD